MQRTEAEPLVNDSVAILAAILTHSDLQGFYHRDTHPERFPLQIIDAANAGLTTVPDSDKTGVPAVLVAKGDAPDPGHASLIIDTFTLSSDMAKVAFRFPVEGLAGTATLAKDHAKGWTINNMRLVEQ